MTSSTDMMALQYPIGKRVPGAVTAFTSASRRAAIDDIAELPANLHGRHHTAHILALRTRNGWEAS